MKRKKTKINIRSLIVTILLATLVLFYFNHLSNKSAKRRQAQQRTEVNELLEYDVLANYPKTPRELAKLHCRFQKVFYSQDLSDDDLIKLNQQVRLLFSQELLEMNPESNALAALKTQIEEADKEDYTYKSFELPQPSQVKEFEKDGREFATFEVKVTVTVGNDMGDMYIQYAMIKENGKWKIYGWGRSQMGE